MGRVTTQSVAAPVLAAIGDQTIDELAELTFTATATDINEEMKLAAAKALAELAKEALGNRERS